MINSLVCIQIVLLVIIPDKSAHAVSFLQFSIECKSSSTERWEKLQSIRMA